MIRVTAFYSSWHVSFGAFNVGIKSTEDSTCHFVKPMSDPVLNSLCTFVCLDADWRSGKNSNCGINLSRIYVSLKKVISYNHCESRSNTLLWLGLYSWQITNFCAWGVAKTIAFCWVGHIDRKSSRGPQCCGFLQRQGVPLLRGPDAVRTN